MREQGEFGDQVNDDIETALGLPGKVTCFEFSLSANIASVINNEGDQKG